MAEHRNVSIDEDPVCGMTVDPEQARAKGLAMTFEDHEYVFCGKGCFLDFDVLIYRENVHTRWFTTAPAPRSRPDEETKEPANKQPALALAA